MSHRTLLATATAALATALLLGLAAPAGAEVTVIKDRMRDTAGHVKYGDITKVRINHGIGNVKVTLRKSADVQALWVDTDAADPGPEYLVAFSAEVPRPGVWEVEDFDRSRIVGTGAGLGAKTCQLPRATILKKDGGYAGFRFDVPRRCLGNPARVRVSLQVATDYPGTTHDWAPAKETFGPWTRSGPI